MPIGRGLAIHVDTGEVRLCKVDRSIYGPDIPLRSCRIFSSEACTLQIIHMPYNKHRAADGKNYKNKNSNTGGYVCGGNEPSSSSSSLLYIEPFMFKQFPELDDYLEYSDEELLKHISTSPMCETPSFCSDAREMLMYLKDHVWWEVFRGGVLVYQRVGVNGWRRVVDHHSLIIDDDSR